MKIELFKSFLLARDVTDEVLGRSSSSFVTGPTSDAATKDNMRVYEAANVSPECGMRAGDRFITAEVGSWCPVDGEKLVLLDSRYIIARL